MVGEDAKVTCLMNGRHIPLVSPGCQVRHSGRVGRAIRAQGHVAGIDRFENRVIAGVKLSGKDGNTYRSACGLGSQAKPSIALRRRQGGVIGRIYKLDAAGNQIGILDAKDAVEALEKNQGCHPLKTHPFARVECLPR